MASVLHRMKNKLPFCIFIFVSICAGLLLWPRYKEKSYVGAVAKLTPAQVHLQKARLERIIIPPDGTLLQDVEAVYVKATLYNPNRVRKTAGETHGLQLLPFSRSKRTLPSALFMRVENGKVFHCGISHDGIPSGLKQMPMPLDAKSMQQRIKSVRTQIQGEERLILNDLLQIQDRYSSGLKTALWNRPSLA